MHFTSELQTPITFLFFNENVKCDFAFSQLECEEYFGHQNHLGFLKQFDFAFSAPPFSEGETLHVVYKKYKIKRKLLIYVYERVYSHFHIRIFT